MHIGKVIREIRKAQDVSIPKVCAAAGVDPGNLSRFERGLTTMRADAIEAVAKALNVPVWKLYFLAQDGAEDQERRRRLLEVLDGLTADQQTAVIRLFGSEMDQQAN